MLIFQVVGYKKTGKTTLVCRLVERFRQEGLQVATIKHDAHGFEPDVPETDSWKHRRSGASMTAVVSAERTAFFEERGAELEELVARMSNADVIVIEGFKHGPYPKMALIHREDHLELLGTLSSCIGIVTWNDRLAAQTDAGIQVLNFTDIESITDAIRNRATLPPL